MVFNGPSGLTRSVRKKEKGSQAGSKVIPLWILKKYAACATDFQRQIKKIPGGDIPRTK